MLYWETQIKSQKSAGYKTSIVGSQYILCYYSYEKKRETRLAIEANNILPAAQMEIRSQEQREVP